jgi:hypothetical protein
VRRLHRLFGLPSSQKLLLLRACTLLAGVVLALRFYAYSKTARWFSSPLITPAVPPASDFEDQVATAISHAATVVPGARCLAQAIVACRILNRAGIPAAVRIGAAKSEGSAIHAHAWVEYEGRIILGGEESAVTYKALSGERSGA